uniref:Uncharacterized protein n=1 Tax=Avena sativa TaxID=4498 RepID=A0ACD5TM75_AVESA
MEHFRRGVEFGTASFQRCHSLSCQMAESTQIDPHKAGARRKEKSPSPRRPKCEEMTVIPEEAMEFLSRTWNPSSSDLFQILSPSCLGVGAGGPPEGHHQEEGETKEEKKEDGDRDLDAVRFDGGKSQLFNQIQTWRVLAGGKTSSKKGKHGLNQPTWLNVGQVRALLRGYFLDNVSVSGSRRRRRRDELRLHSAQAHAAVSVAQLAAAIAGVVSACELRRVDGDSSKLGAVLASAAALVATVCAEAAESAGANRPRVTSAVKTGLESRSPADLLTLTAAAATCLRGAAALKLRAADVRGISTGANGNGNAMAMSISAGIQKGIALRVCLPCGKVRVRTVSVSPRRGGGTVALRLGKKRLRGAFATYEDHEVLAVSPGGEAVVDGRRCFAVALSTSAGTVQLLLEDQTHCKVWNAAIQGMLSDAKQLKHAK